MTDYLRRLSSWLVEAGGHHANVEIRELGQIGDQTRGVVATAPIAASSEVVRVPRSLLITVETARAQLVERELVPAELELSSKHFMLAVWLLVERRDPRSMFQPYLDALPGSVRSFRSFPVFASPQERALLDGSLTGAMLDRLRASLEADHRKLMAVAPGLEIGLDALVWAAMCVLSRSFGVTIDGQHTAVLAPFIDMFNHARGSNTRLDYDAEGQAFRVISERAYPPGEEVCVDYGRRSNLYLLLHYGFCIDHNDDDEALLGFPAHARITRSTDEPTARMLLFQLRGQRGNEASARAALAEAARAALARFSTTVAEDQALLAGRELSLHARNFIVTRLGEKRVLHAWLALASEGSPALFRWP
ncbi:MAG TPA: SET domain-containing protein-lysine N-methyltransferase [Kofleriaceae bacterium]|nr:SET domain-containing protein-lysine N-methyltransferase [Kofleriaceae bacterium]